MLEKKPPGFEDKIANSLKTIDQTVGRITKIILGMKQLLRGDRKGPVELQDFNQLSDHFRASAARQ